MSSKVTEMLSVVLLFFLYYTLVCVFLFFPDAILFAELYFNAILSHNLFYDPSVI
jgi:hypothetical protein